MQKENSSLSKSAIEPLELQNSWTTTVKRIKPKIHDFYGVLESVAWIWRILGVFPITTRGSIGTKRYGLSKFWAVYSISMFVICLSNFIYGVTQISTLFSHRIPMTSVTILIRTVASLLCMICSNFWRIIRYRELSETINRLSEQEMILEKMMSFRFNYDSNAKIIRAYVWTTFVIIILLILYDLYGSVESLENITIEWILWIFPLISQVMDLTILVSLVGWLGLKFRAINEKIQTVVMRTNASSPKLIVTVDVCAENLRTLAKAHYNTCAIGKRINRIFDWNMIFNVATAFIILSTSLYYIFYEVHRDGKTNIVQIISYVHWEVIHSVPIIVVVIICNWTFRQEIYTGRLIHEIRVERTDSRLYEIVKSFSLQLHHQKLEFTAGGFFPLNSSLLQTMVGNITTYLVILIQFQPKLD